MVAIQKLDRRERTRFNQTELALRWHTSQASVSRWMEGKKIPGRRLIKVIAADCDVDPGWLDWGTPVAESELTPTPGSGGAEQTG